MSQIDSERLWRGTGHIPHPDYVNVDFFGAQDVARFAGLKEIYRFHKIAEMTHRRTDAEHVLSTAGSALSFSTMLLELGVDHYLPHVLFAADNHENPELITGDIATPDKRNATPEQKAKMHQDELDAASELEWMVQRPKSIESHRKFIEEYRKQEHLPYRIVKHADSIDGVCEALHDAICGDNRRVFQQVVREYKPDFEKLAEKDADWMPYIRAFLGEDFFVFPDADALPQRTMADLDLTNADTLIASLSKDAPAIYKFWLRVNKNIFKLDFLDACFPGWEGEWPSAVEEDIARVKRGDPYNQTPSGLFVPTQVNLSQPSFGESLMTGDMFERIQVVAPMVRKKLGVEPSPEKYWFRAPQM